MASHLVLLIFQLLLLHAHSLPTATRNFCNVTSSAVGYDVSKVAQQARQLASHSWEYGTAAEALLELYDPDVSVFSTKAFPKGRIPVRNTTSTDYAKQFINLNSTTLIDGDGAVGDPASLGVSAILLGQTSSSYLSAASREADYILNTAPRFYNGAISHRANTPALWADFIYMAPPFLAYYAVATRNASLLSETVRQCGLYRQILLSNGTATIWEHIISPSGGSDLKRWSTGNAWAAAGMARVLATALHWDGAGGNRTNEKNQLVQYVGEIVDGAMQVGVDNSTGLLRNYLDDASWFGETSGTALFAATVYRMAVLVPEAFATSKYLGWADDRRKAVAAHVDENGILSPAVNPLNWGSHTPYTIGSPEGQSFGVLLYAAYRDCVCAGMCK